MPSQIFTSATHLNVNRVIPSVMAVPTVVGGALVLYPITYSIRKHIAILQGFGISDLSTLGKLPISGNVIPQVGLLKPLLPTTRFTDIIDRTTTFSGALHVHHGSNGASVPLDRIGGPAYVLKAEPFAQIVLPPSRLFRGGPLSPVFYPSSVLPIPTAYWAANEIEIADNTLIILQQPYHWLVIIANKITFGNNVTFTWVQEDKGIPDPPKKLETPDPPPTSIYMSGTNGNNGSPGSLGGNGRSGDDGPEIEIWTLDINQLPSEVIIAGQNGFQGGKGQDGQEGQDGARGRGFVLGAFPGTCKSGPGNGGIGGNGGSGGTGGKGGDGGHGGRFNIYAPPPILSVISSQGFYIDVKEGQGGDGGVGGNGGVGGAGGLKGNDRNGVGCPGSYGKNGKAGKSGVKGISGAVGSPGQHYNDGEKFYPIDINTFINAFNKPAITGLSAESACCNEVISVLGKKFTNSDLIFVDNVQALTTFISDTLVTFIVPYVNGGRQKSVYIKQQDGTTSNNATLHVLPKILWIEQNGQKTTDGPDVRLIPGKIVKIVGSGFSKGLSIMINEQYVSYSDINFIDSTSVSFTLFRPPNVVQGPVGENVNIKVILNDSQSFTSVQIILDTIVMVVFGDSIQWGQGLREDLKFHSLVKQHVGKNDTIGVYKTVLAHSGATIGVGDNNQYQAVYGEVPTSYPTILQQIDQYSGDPKLVDLIMIDGGINDIGVDEIVSPIKTSDLDSLTQKYCYNDMKCLLEKVTEQTRFTQAKIIVTGYYPIVTDDSSLSALILLLAGLGMYVGGLAGAIVGGVVSSSQRDVMVSRCKRFANEANKKLQQVVNDVNLSLVAQGRNEQLFFAKPNFEISNAIFASNSFLWGIENDLGPADDEQIGGVEQVRSVACHFVDSHESGRTSMTRCIRASIGHPNVKGAQEYSRVINALL